MLDYKTEPVDEKLYHREKFDEVLARVPENYRKGMKIIGENKTDRLVIMAGDLRIVLNELKWLDESEIEKILQESEKTFARGKHGRG